MEKWEKFIIAIFIIISFIAGREDGLIKVDTPNQFRPEFVNKNDGWVTATNGQRYKHQLSCNSGQACFYINEDECYLIAEWWEKGKICPYKNYN